MKWVWPYFTPRDWRVNIAGILRIVRFLLWTVGAQFLFCCCVGILLSKWICCFGFVLALRRTLVTVFFVMLLMLLTLWPFSSISDFRLSRLLEWLRYRITTLELHIPSSWYVWKSTFFCLSVFTMILSWSDEFRLNFYLVVIAHFQIVIEDTAVFTNNEKPFHY